MNDQQAIMRVLSGETDAFRVLVTRHQDTMFCLLRNLLPDRHLCEDIAQEAMLAAYANLQSYDASRASFRTWLLTIARNKCFHWLEKQKSASSLRLAESSTPAALAEAAETSVTGKAATEPAASMEREEFFQQLDAALQRLPFEQRTAFVLAELQELSYEEIAQIEQVALGTVKSRIARAKAKLREAFPQLVEEA